MANNCENTTIYDSLRFCPGDTVLPGVRKCTYYAPKSAIASWPTLPKTSASMKQLAIYQGSFVMAADAVFKRIDLTLNKGRITYETQGEKPSRTFLNKGVFNHPYNNEEAAGFARQAVADDFVFVTQQRDGKWRVLGSEMFETDVKVGGDTGEGTTGEVGTTIDVDATDECPAPFYVGTLVTDDGEIDCSGNPVAGE